MNKMKLFVAISSAIAISGCATQPRPEVAPTPESEILSMIAQAAQRATDAQVRLASTRSSNKNLVSQDNSKEDGLDTPISINWSGPIDRLAEKVAELSGFGYGGIIGQKPATPVMVSISVSGEKARAILLSANAQSGISANIKVVEGENKIVVQYPPTIKTGGFPILK